MSLPEDLDALARTVIDGNRYMTLGTSEADQRPRLSPVYFKHAGYRTFYWVSSPEARHSGNVAARPEVAIVIYDSSVEIGQGRAVYIDATASIVPDEELPERCAEAFPEVDPGAAAELVRPEGHGAAWTRPRGPERAPARHVVRAAFEAVTATVA